MTSFTPQQLTGGPKYNHNVRIGNWSEDLELEEIKVKDYLKKKDTGTLIVTGKQRQLESSLVPTDVDASPEGVVKYGMKIMLVSNQTQGILSANPFDRADGKAYDSWMVTTARMQHSPPGTVRNVFEIESAERSAVQGEVCYGQTLRLKLDKFSALTAPAYLHSELVTPMVAAKFSRHQEVVATAEPSGETKWQVVHPHPDLRGEAEGQPVPAGEPVLLKHVQTGSYLASDEIPYHNVFGPECEVHCFTYGALTKPAILAGEAKGETENSQKVIGKPNLWTFVTSTHEGAADRETLDQTGLPA